MPTYYRRRSTYIYMTCSRNVSPFDVTVNFAVTRKTATIYIFSSCLLCEASTIANLPTENISETAFGPSAKWLAGEGGRKRRVASDENEISLTSSYPCHLPRSNLVPRHHGNVGTNLVSQPAFQILSLHLSSPHHPIFYHSDLIFVLSLPSILWT